MILRRWVTETSFLCAPSYRKTNPGDRARAASAAPAASFQRRRGDLAAGRKPIRDYSPLGDYSLVIDDPNVSFTWRFFPSEQPTARCPIVKATCRSGRHPYGRCALGTLTPDAYELARYVEVESLLQSAFISRLRACLR